MSGPNQGIPLRRVPSAFASLSYTDLMWRGVVVLILLAFISVPAPAQEFWAKKDWHSWSAEECKKILENSPWSQGRIFGGEAYSTPGTAASEIIYTAQLWSALPVRQAAVRGAQLHPSFDKLSEAERQALRERHAKVIDTDFSERVVVKVLYSVRAQTIGQELSMYFRTRAQGNWRQDTLLVTSAGQVPVSEVRVAPEGGEFQLIFPRNKNGKPIIHPGDEEFHLEFKQRSVGAVGVPYDVRVVIRFRIADLIVNEKLLL